MHRRSCAVALGAIIAFATCSSADDYTIGPDDVLAVFVADHPELSIEKTAVSRSGSLTHPVWGEVQVQGLSKSQVEAAIREHLAADFLTDPRVAVTILQSSQLLVWMLSPTAGTNAYHLNVNGTLSELLITAGAPTPVCNSMFARITRREKLTAADGNTGTSPPLERLVQTTVDLHDLMVLGRDGLDVPLRRNDRVQLVYRDPRIRSTVRCSADSSAVGANLVFALRNSVEAQTCSYNTTDTPALTPAHVCISLGPDEMTIPAGLPAIADNCVTVCGAVLHQGAVELATGMTLGGAVAQAGLAPSAGSLSRIVHVTRGDRSGRTNPPKAAVWYMRSAAADDAYGLHEPLRMGDIIFVIGDAVE